MPLYNATDRPQDIWLLRKSNGESGRRRHVHQLTVASWYADVAIVGQFLHAPIDPKKLAKLARLSATTPPLHVVEGFIVSLTEASEGKH